MEEVWLSPQTMVMSRLGGAEFWTDHARCRVARCPSRAGRCRTRREVGLQLRHLLCGILAGVDVLAEVVGRRGGRGSGPAWPACARAAHRQTRARSSGEGLRARSPRAPGAGRCTRTAGVSAVSAQTTWLSQTCRTGCGGFMRRPRAGRGLWSGRRRPRCRRRGRRVHGRRPASPVASRAAVEQAEERALQRPRDRQGAAADRLAVDRADRRDFRGAVPVMKVIVGAVQRLRGRSRAPPRRCPGSAPGETSRA